LRSAEQQEHGPCVGGDRSRNANRDQTLAFLRDNAGN
jgi:hypothetical protein